MLICIEFEGDCIGWLAVLLLCCLVCIVGLVMLLGLVKVVKDKLKGCWVFFNISLRKL